MNNNEFLDTISKSFKKFLETGSRSNQKLKILHGSIAEDLKERLGEDYDIKSLNLNNGKECNIPGRYIDKKVDITIIKDKKISAGIGVKFVMQNYSQNSNNYFENMLGETANIRSTNTPYFQIFIIPDKIPYYDNKGYIKNWEEFSIHNMKKYNILSQDNIETFFHTPTKTLLSVIHLPELNKDKIKTRENYNNFYRNINNLRISFSNNSYKKIQQSVIFNDYDSFITKVIYYLRSL
jgi:phosphotransferase system IIB component